MEIKMSEQSEEKKMSQKMRWLLVLAVSFTVFLVLSYVYFKYKTYYRGGISYDRFICGEQLKSIARELTRYALDHKGLFPDPNKWCDLLLENKDFDKAILRCLDDKTGPCSFAVNPNCSSFFSPAELVLAFEAKPGWNQHGGPEMLNPDNHYSKGCNIFFNDGFVRFIEPNDFNSLKWK